MRENLYHTFGSCLLCMKFGTIIHTVIYEQCCSNLSISKVWGIKKVSKLRWKIYLTKNCPIWFRLPHFLDKTPGKIMESFNQNRQLFIKKTFSSKNVSWKLWYIFCFTNFLKSTIIISWSIFRPKLYSIKKCPSWFTL